MRIVCFILCFVFCVSQGFTQVKYKGEKGISSVGGIVGYAIESEQAVVGFDFRYNVLNRVRLAPSVLYHVKKNDTDDLFLNADVHYLGRITPKMTLYPLAGLGVSFLRHRTPNILPMKEKYVTETRLGLNLGFGGEVRVSKDLIIGAEFRYNWTERWYNRAMLLARVATYF